MPRPSAQQLINAPKSFRFGTGVGSDDIHPRLFAELSEVTIEHLIEIIMLCERCRVFPSRVGVILYWMIPKARGGWRPIALLASSPRLWEALRVGIVKEWAVAHTREYNYAAPGLSADQAAFSQLVFAEAAQAEDSPSMVVSGATFADLEKADEKVQLRQVWLAAIRHGFPLHLLAIISVIYTLERRFLVGGCLSRPLWTLVSICAGSRFAPFLLFLVLVTPCDNLVSFWPEAQLRLYVDDVAVTLAGDCEFVARALSSCTGYLIRAL